ncbi:MAG TPA: ABC transporter permease [Burkholderiales bacterium]|nr:ABC transporter permease [Burkholderiales bacterium]
MSTTRNAGGQVLARAAAGMRLDLRLAIRNVLRHKRRSAVAIGAVAAGVVALLLAGGFFEFVYQAIRESTIRARIGHIQITRAGYRESGTSQPYAFMLPETSEVRKQIESYPEVEVVAPRLTFNGLISIGDSTKSFFGEGVDPVRERKLSGAMAILEGEDLAESQRNGIILGQGLAQTLEVKIGTPVVLLATPASGAISGVDATVRGIFGTSVKAYDDYALRMPLKAAQALLRTKDVHAWLVLLHDTRQTDEVLQRITPLLKANGLEGVPWYANQLADFYNKTVKLFSEQVLVLKIMIGVIIVLSISNTMMTSVRERISEIGTSMALGDRGSVVLRRFLAEGAVTGVIGGVIGVIVGVLLAMVITWIGIPMPAPPGMARGYIAGIVVTPQLVADGLILSASTALLAGIYPAWRAARMNTVDALRHAH